MNKVRLFSALIAVFLLTGVLYAQEDKQEEISTEDTSHRAEESTEDVSGKDRHKDAEKKRITKNKSPWRNKTGLGAVYSAGTSGDGVTILGATLFSGGTSNDNITAFPNAESSISFHIPNTPIFLGAGIVGSHALLFSRSINKAFDKDVGGNFTIDFVLLSELPAKWFEVRLALGASTSLFSYNDGYLIGLSLGLRLPIGISFWIGKKAKVVEIFLQAVPTIGFGIGFDNPAKGWFHVGSPLELGVRFWF